MHMIIGDWCAAAHACCAQLFSQRMGVVSSPSSKLAKRRGSRYNAGVLRPCIPAANDAAFEHRRPAALRSGQPPPRRDASGFE